MKFGALVLWTAVMAAASGVQESPPSGLRLAHQTDDPEVLKTLVVAGNAGLVDTGMDVAEGSEFDFTAEGQISLQKGNPEASCGPEGYDIQGIQQPLPDENLGCLIGQVVRLLAVREDEKTGEEIRDELVERFPIGRSRTVVMPISGRLFVGINENVVKDNDGGFTVHLFSRKNTPRHP